MRETDKIRALINENNHRGDGGMPEFGIDKEKIKDALSDANSILADNPYDIDMAYRRLESGVEFAIDNSNNFLI